LADKIAWIAESNFSGSPRDHVRSGLRGLPYRKRCIYFRISDDTTFIIRVLHQSQDIDKNSFDENTK